MTCCLTPCSDKITKGPSSKNWGFYNHNALSVYTGRNKIVKLNVSTFTETLTIIVCISIQIEKKNVSQLIRTRRNQRVYFSSKFSYLTAAEPVWRWENSHVLSDCCWQHHHELVCPECERERERERGASTNCKCCLTPVIQLYHHQTRRRRHSSRAYVFAKFLLIENWIIATESGQD